MSELSKPVVEVWKNFCKKCGDIMSHVDKWTNEHRASTLICVLIFCLILFLSVANSESVRHSSPFWPFGFLKDYDRLESKELIQFMMLLLGLPVAFLVWHWRDVNKRAEIENARKDTNLKEFQEVQLRAAGALDIELPQEAREQLQIAALHQLRGFLRGEYGESFKRPAFEILWPSDGVSKDRVLSLNEFLADMDGRELDEEFDYRQYVDGIHKNLSRVALEKISIAHDEWKYYFRNGFPLNGRNFSFLKLPLDADLSELDLSGCWFVRSCIERVRFENSILKFSVFDRSFAQGASFRNADMYGAHIQFVGLSPDNRVGVTPLSKSVDFRNTKLDLAMLRFSICCGAQIQGASLPYLNDDMMFENAVFDDATSMNLGTSADADMINKQLRKLGARHANDPPA